MEGGQLASQLTDRTHTGGGLLSLPWRVHVDIAAHRRILLVDLPHRHALAMSAALSQAACHCIGTENNIYTSTTC